MPPPTVALSHETLRERILTTGGGGGTVPARGSLAKVASRYAELVQSIAAASTTTTTMTKNNIDVAKRAFDIELRLYDIEVRKLALAARAANVNSTMSVKTQGQLENTLHGAQREVASLTEQLSQERASKRRREEYDTLAKLGSIVGGGVGGGGGEQHNNDEDSHRRRQHNRNHPSPPMDTSSSFPPVRTTRMELDTIQNEITQVTQDVNKLKYELRVKECQLRVVMTALVDLGSTWTEEKEKDTKKEEGEVVSEK
jgi:hypothetical protein